MKHLLFVVGALFATSASALTEDDFYRDRNLVCNTPGVECGGFSFDRFEVKLAEQTTFQTVTFADYQAAETSLRDGYNVPLPAESEDEALERKRRNLWSIGSWCTGGAGACTWVLTRVRGFWPGLVISAACATGFSYCGFWVNGELNKLDEEIKRREEEKRKNSSDISDGGSGDGQGGGFGGAGGPVFGGGVPVRPAPIVEIIDLPSN